MFAGGAAARAGCATGGAPRWTPRAGGGPSGTTTALVIVASASFRVVRLSHGVAAAAAARSKSAVPVMVPLSTRELRRRVPLKGASLLLAADVGHVGDARDLPVLVHADVLVVDRVVVVGQRIDHDLLQHAVALVVNADTLRIDDLDGSLGALLTLDRPVDAVEQRHVAPVLRRIAGIAHRELAAVLFVHLVGHDVIGIGRIVPNADARGARVGIVGFRRPS